jgi:acid stress-induced BolA-like protein IbaG/YrbA
MERRANSCLQITATIITLLNMKVIKIVGRTSTFIPINISRAFEEISAKAKIKAIFLQLTTSITIHLIL